jgi:hypothetical protein
MTLSELEAVEALRAQLREEARRQLISGHQPPHPARPAAPFGAMASAEERAEMAARQRAEARAWRLQAAASERPRLDMVPGTPSRQYSG